MAALFVKLGPVLKAVWGFLTSPLGSLLAWAAASSLLVACIVGDVRTATAQRQVSALTRERDQARTDLGTAKANTATLQASLASQNAAVAALQAEGARRSAAASQAVQAAQQAEHVADANAAKVLAIKPGPDPCRSADALILGAIS